MDVFLHILLVKLAMIGEDLFGKQLIGREHLRLGGIKFDAHKFFNGWSLGECLSLDS